MPIAVVDDDRTPLSRRLIQALDADEAISVAVRAPALDVAQQALFDRRVFGILEIPPDTEREVLKGNEARIPAYVGSAYFLVFNRTLQGIAEATGNINTDDISRGLRIDGGARGVSVFAWKGETEEEYEWCIEQTLCGPGGWRPNMALDDDGDAIEILHYRHPGLTGPGV